MRFPNRRERERTWQSLFERSPLPQYVMEHRTWRILAANDAMTELYNYTRDELLAMRAQDLRPVEEVARFERHMAGLAPEAYDRGLFRHRTRDGRVIDVAVHSSPVRFNRAPARLATILDLTAQRDLEQALRTSRERLDRLERLSENDVLTGIANRATFARAVGDAIALGRGVAVAIIDLERFGNVNAVFGAAIGDALLRQVARRLSAALRPGEFAARLGNDEFGVLLEACGTIEAALVRAEALRTLLTATYAHDSDEITLGANIGVALAPQDATDAGGLLRNAELALAAARAEHAGSARAFSAELTANLAERHRLELDLHRALERGEFQLHYQPIVDLERRQPTGVEALIRWRQPGGRLVAPGEFIARLEESGEIVAAGEWVLADAARQARAWLDAGLTIGTVSINVSPRQFAQANLVERFAEIVDRVGVPASTIELEITESSLMQNAAQAAETLARLKRYGFRLAIDDFGTGYSSLAYLKRFRVDVLKIDQSFVRDVVPDWGSMAIVRTTIALAHSLGLQVVGEGVEGAAQASLLGRIGCDRAQGYFFCHPAPAPVCAEWLARRACPEFPRNGDSRQATILVVDDNPDDVYLLEHELRRDGYRILVAPGAAQALEQLAVHSVDLIISDQRMVEMSGVEFLSRAKRMYPEAVRIMLTGDTEPSSVTDAVNRGAVFKYLAKPWDPEQLRRIVREAIDERLRAARIAAARASRPGGMRKAG